MTELTIDQALQKGIQAHKAGQMQEADRLYTAILKAQPKHPDANHNLGILAISVGKIEEALPFFKTALEANPNTGQFWLSYIDTLIKLDKLVDAKAVFDQAKSRDAKGDGFDKLEQRLKDAGQELLETSKSAAKAPLLPSNILNSLKLEQALKLAKKKVKADSPEEAKRIYQDILVKFPKNKRANDGLKRLVGRPIGEDSKVQDIPKDELQVLMDLYKKGQLSIVIERAKFLTKQYPKAFTIWNLMGVAATQNGQLDQAIFAFSKALTIKPDNAGAYNNLGNALKEQGKLEEAIEAYSIALAIKPNNPEAYNNMGHALKEQSKLEDAVASYNKALAIKPDYAEAYNNLGNILREQGKLEEAIEAYNKALAIKPDYAEVARNLVKLPIGSINQKIILGLNTQFSFLRSKIQDRSQRLFFEANIFAHNGNYDDAFEIFVEANRIKSNYVATSVKNLTQKYAIQINRIHRWSPHPQRQSDHSVKKLFILGPSRSGKSSLEKLLMGNPEVYPMFENINLKAMGASEVSIEELQQLSMVDLFYHDENSLLKLGYSVITSTKPESIFHMDHLLDICNNSFCIMLKRNQTDVASEIFSKEYKKGNLYSYDHSSILQYLKAYEAIWKIVKQKVPHRTIEVSFEDIYNKPQDTVNNISQLIGVNFEVDNPPNHSTKNLVSRFKEHYISRFMSP